METKECIGCGTEYPVTTEFFRFEEHNSQFGSYRNDCHSCETHYSRGRYKALKGIKSQPLGTPCALCGRSDRKLVRDHDHQTLRFRGHICQNCNRVIAWIENLFEIYANPFDVFQRVITYLNPT